MQSAKKINTQYSNYETFIPDEEIENMLSIQITTKVEKTSLDEFVNQVTPLNVVTLSLKPRGSTKKSYLVSQYSKVIKRFTRFVDE